MNPWELLTSIEIDGISYAIRTDFRAVLDVLTAMSDPDLFLPDASDQEKAYIRMDTLLQIMVEDYENLPPEKLGEACEVVIEFIDCGMKDDGKRKPHTMDWQQDAQIIIPAINRVQGTEIRALPYLHWWTFLGAYMEIGECLFAQVVHIRQKKQNHQKLEKWENDFYNQNKDIIDLRKKISEEQKIEMENLEKWL
jgi:hypothetical protein